MKRYIDKIPHENRIYALIFIISLLSIVISIVVQIEKTQYEASQPSICSIVTGSNGCEAVQTSEYASTLGIDNPIYGIIGFSMLAIFSAMYLLKGFKIIKYLILTGSIFSSIVAIWFLYLQAFVLHKYCIFCIMVDTLSLILLGIAAYILVRKEIKK